MKTRSVLIAAAAAASVISVSAAGEDAARTIAALDTEYQAAVERNDWQTMDRILHPDFVLVLGNGTTYRKQQLIDSARARNVVYEKQVEVEGTQTVRLYGKDTATVTALLLLKGVRKGEQLHYKLWFTDTYVRTPEGWRYAFGQASTPMPQT